MSHYRPLLLLLAVWLVLTVIWLTAVAALGYPTEDCYTYFDDAWCDHTADALADMPLWDDLSSDEAGGYAPGDPVDTTWGHSVPAPPEALDAVAVAGRRLGGPATSWAEARLMVDLGACESDLELDADNPTSTADGPWQFLRSTWARVAAATGFHDRGAWTDNANNALWLGRNSGWQSWECLGRVR